MSSALFGATRWRNLAIGAALVLATLALGLVDPNNELLSANDVYILRQINVYADIFTWSGQDVASLAAVADKIGRFLFWFFYYFHGAPPQLYQAPLYVVASAAGFSVTPLFGQAMVSAIVAATVVLFWRCLARAGIAWPIAASTALLLTCSPMLTGISRGFGVGWIANAAFSQALLLYAFLRLRDGAGQWLLGVTCAHVVLSDPISFLLIGTLLFAWIVPDRWQGVAPLLRYGLDRLALLASPKIWLPPLVAALAVALWNVLRARYAAVLPSTPTLFVYPFANYLGAAVTQGSGFGPADWLRICVISFGFAAPIGFVVLLLLSTVLRKGASADVFTWRWALVSSLGYAFMFYVISPGGSQMMPYLGYPIYTLIPFLTLAALALDRLAANYATARALALPALALCVVVALLNTVSYIWQRPILPGSSLLAVEEGAGDNIGIRLPYGGHAAGAMVVRHVIERSLQSDGARPLRVLYVRNRENMGHDTFWVSTGLDRGGQWFEQRLGKRPSVDFLQLHSGEPVTEWQLYRVDAKGVSGLIANRHIGARSPCAARACVVIDTTGTASDDDLIRRLAAAPDLTIQRSDRPAYALFVIGDKALLPMMGSSDGRDLEHRFFRDVRSTRDYFASPAPLEFTTRLRDSLVRH